MANKYIVTWDDFHLYSRNLAKLLLDKSWKGIISINRDGLILAALLARELQIERIDTLKEEDILKQTGGDAGGDIIFVTDIVTNDLKKIRTIFNSGYFASIFVQPNCLSLVDKYIIEIKKDMEILEPWNTKYSYVPPLKDITK